MVLVVLYSKDEYEKEFYIDYRVSHTPKLIYHLWKKKFEDLNFINLEYEIFEKAFNSILQNKQFVSDSFNLSLLNISK